MLKTYVPSACGNAPKKQVLIDFNIAFAKGHVNEILNYMIDDVEWGMIGDKIEVEKLLKEMVAYKAEAVRILTVITHGKDASVRGVLKFENQEVAFADFYEFNSAGSKKIKRLTSYGIDIK